jgi:hypothetical protein
MKYQIWYMRPEWFREGVCYAKPDPKNLEATHIPLMDLFVPDADAPGKQPALDRIYASMQAEVWSPNGGARALIRGRGLDHTSMSVGDVIVDPEGRAQLVASAGFEDLGLRLEPAIEQSPDAFDRNIAGDR